MIPHVWFWIVLASVDALDVMFNVFAALVFSGALDGAIPEYKKKEQIEILRLEKRRLLSASFSASDNNLWRSKV